MNIFSTPNFTVKQFKGANFKYEGIIFNFQTKNYLELDIFDSKFKNF